MKFLKSRRDSGDVAEVVRVRHCIYALAHHDLANGTSLEAADAAR